MHLPINLWNPTSGLPIPWVLLTAWLLGMLHGITPDEHTWPITFSYAIGSYSRRGGLMAGLSFSLAFTVQRGIASELAYLALARWMENPHIDAVVYVIVGMAMAAAGFYIRTRGAVIHLHGLETHRHDYDELREIPPQLAMVHGFLAGWGFGSFALILYTVLAPSMHSAWWGWAPGVMFGLGTTLVQALAGMLFGHWMTRLGFSAGTIRRIAQSTAGTTLWWGGWAFVTAGTVSLIRPAWTSWAVVTPLKIHNLHTLGIGFVLVTFTVLIVGFGSLWRAVKWAKHHQVRS
ncbi:MAG: hypothetical protein OWQ57_00985 [Sulfobacillus sp.]|nr:hypothetical protein [Sulfobacillus sp.]